MPGPDPILPRNRYAAFVGVVFVVVAVVALFNFVTSREPGIIGLGGDEIGAKLPRFALPDATGPLEGDANIDPKRACEVKEPGAIRLCDFFGKPLVISFWFTRGTDCAAQQDVVNRVAADLRGKVGFLSINVRNDREEVRELAEERGWTMPLGHDRDGAVSTLYRVGVCPTFVYVTPDGRLQGADLGELDADELTERALNLVRESRGVASAQ